MSVVSYVPRTSLEAIIVSDGKYRGLLHIQSRRRSSKKLDALIQKACEKHDNIQEISEFINAAGWDAQILGDNRNRKLFVSDTSRMLDVRSTSYSVQDVISNAQDTLKVRLSVKKAREILHLMIRKHNMDQGITWDVMTFWTQEVLSGKYPS
jgi:hypothetical protein